jgi:hypothetical protein
MQLQYIKYTTCPECGAPAVTVGVEADRNGKIREHAHGGRWEHIHFACGRRDRYIPNFSSIETTIDCKNGAAETARRAKIEAARTQLTAFVEKLDVEDAFKERIIDSVKYYS